MENKVYEALFSEAEKQYDLEDRSWFEERSDEELAILWSECIYTDSNPLGAAWDDEVYDAIADRKNEKEIFKRARVILREREKEN